MKISWIDEKGLKEHLPFDRKAGSAVTNPAWSHQSPDQQSHVSLIVGVYRAPDRPHTQQQLEVQMQRLVSSQRNGVGDAENHKISLILLLTTQSILLKAKPKSCR